MCDIVGEPRDLGTDAENSPPCLVFEWMDQTLRELSPADHQHNTALFKAIFEAGLNSLATLADQKLVHKVQYWDLLPSWRLLSSFGGLSVDATFRSQAG